MLEPQHRGGSYEYPQSVFLIRNKKNNIYPCKLQFYYKKKWGLRGQNYTGMFSWWALQKAQWSVWPVKGLFVSFGGDKKIKKTCSWERNQIYQN